MNGRRKYVISFSGLSVGKHEYEYRLGDAFFEKIEYSEIKKAEVRIDVRLNKQSDLLMLDFIVRGKVLLPCDRCAEEFSVKINGEYQLFVKLGGMAGEAVENEDMIRLTANEGELDIAHQLYEYSLLSIPHKRIHPKLNDCNQETLKKLKEFEASTHEQQGDPRWDLLKKLKFNN
jgi:uncharacterized protein